MKKIISKAVAEDIGQGDYTTLATVKKKIVGEARIFSKQHGVLAGVEVASLVFRQVDKNLKIINHCKDGQHVNTNTDILTIKGKLASILKAERTALNFLGYLSGISTLTAKFVEKVKDTGICITDTRKTTPLLRTLEKQAVRLGGGVNHRMGLYDMVLIKENHIKAAGGISQAVERTIKYLKKNKKKLRIEHDSVNLTRKRLPDLI